VDICACLTASVQCSRGLRGWGLGHGVCASIGVNPLQVGGHIPACQVTHSCLHSGLVNAQAQLFDSMSGQHTEMPCCAVLCR
jgi:hypothetical protein